MPHLFAHRGASGEAPENTFPAFDRAVELGLPFLELDCHGSRDGEIVVCHDPDVARTTNGSGLIRALSYREIAALDAGHAFALADGSHPFRGRGIAMPRLGDVLDRYPRARLNLEIKQRDPPIARRVVELVQRRNAAGRVLLAAEDHQLLESIRELEPGTALGSSLADALGFFGALDSGALEQFAPRGHALQIPPRVGSRELITPESVAGAKRVGLFLHVWTIDDPAEMAGLFALGVHGIMSNFPVRLLEAARRAASSGPTAPQS